MKRMAIIVLTSAITIAFILTYFYLEEKDKNLSIEPQKEIQVPAEMIEQRMVCYKKSDGQEINLQVTFQQCTNGWQITAMRPVK